MIWQPSTCWLIINCNNHKNDCSSIKQSAGYQIVTLRNVLRLHGNKNVDWLDPLNIKWLEPPTIMLKCRNIFTVRKVEPPTIMRKRHVMMRSSIWKQHTVKVNGPSRPLWIWLSWMCSYYRITSYRINSPNHTWRTFDTTHYEW